MRRWAVQKDLRRRVGEHRKCIGHLPPTSILICLLEGYQQKRKPVQCALYLASQELVGNLADLESHQPQVALLSVPAAPFSAALELEGGRVGTELLERAKNFRGRCHAAVASLGYRKHEGARVRRELFHQLLPLCRAPRGQSRGTSRPSPVICGPTDQMLIKWLTRTVCSSPVSAPPASKRAPAPLSRGSAGAGVSRRGPTNFAKVAPTFRGTPFGGGKGAW